MNRSGVIAAPEEIFATSSTILARLLSWLLWVMAFVSRCVENRGKLNEKRICREKDVSDFVLFSGYFRARISLVSRGGLEFDNVDALQTEFDNINALQTCGGA